ncbi:muconolactone Delta-isomerase [Corynebacterium freneyi]
MLFLARMDVHFPESMDRPTIADFQAREREYSADLQRRGIMKAIWRVVGEYANYSVFDVDDHDELHGILQGFPMFAHMGVKITALAKHPNALEYYLRD